MVIRCIRCGLWSNNGAVCTKCTGDTKTSPDPYWVTESVYCTLCGNNWQAVYDANNTNLLECPSCHGMSAINIINNEVTH
jgi:hydrogenase maturation factor HypF (carbamoyltransferase family)